MGSSEDIHSLPSQQNYQYSPYGSRFWRSTPSLAHVDEPEIDYDEAPNHHQALDLPSSPRVNGYGDQKTVDGMYGSCLNE